jgi:hypothetical protein
MEIKQAEVKLIDRICTWYKCFRCLINPSSYEWDCIYNHFVTAIFITAEGELLP